MAELSRQSHSTKKVAKLYVDNSHMKLSYELEIRKFGQIRQQGAMLTLSHFYGVTMLAFHCWPNSRDILLYHLIMISLCDKVSLEDETIILTTEGLYTGRGQKSVGIRWP